MYEDSWKDKDFYGVLDISKSADEAEIKKAYRKAARKYHPDTNPGPDSEGKFAEVGLAFEVLSDPAKRKAYDAGPGLGAFGSFDFGNFDFGNFGTTTGDTPDYTDPEKFPEFADILGGDKFSDLRDVLNRAGFSGFGESTDGTAAAARDEGLGARARDRFGDALGGLGGMFENAKTAVKDRVQNATPTPVVQTVEVSFFEAADGVVKSVQTPDGAIDVRVPAGVKDGQKLRASGTVFAVSVAEDKMFSREGDDLIVSLPVSLLEAVQGTVKKMRLPGSNGVAFKLPANCANRASKLRGKGFNGGDAIIKPYIVLPDDLNETHVKAASAFDAA